MAEAENTNQPFFEKPPLDETETDQRSCQTKSKGKKPVKKTSWSQDEEKLLAECWICISEDSNAQHSVSFWNRVLIDYNKVADVKRSKDQVTSKWRDMNAYVKLFNDHYEKASRDCGSGEGDEKVLTMAMKMYEAAKHATFKNFSAWMVLKDKSKWKNPKPVVDGTRNKKRPIDVEGEEIRMTLEYEDFELLCHDPIPRPTEKPRCSKSQRLNYEDFELLGHNSIPRLTEKPRGSKSQRSSSTSETSSHESNVFCDDALKQFKKITRFKIEVAKTKQEAAKAQQYAEMEKLKLEELRFLGVCTDFMSEKDRRYVEKQKDDIRQKYDIK